MTSRLNCLALITLSFSLCGCAETSNENSGTASASISAASFNPTDAPTVEFTLPDMMCEDGCTLTVRDILLRQPGAKDVRVDFEGKMATVAIDPSTFDSQQAIAELVDKGFDKSALAGSESSAEPQADEAANQAAAASSPSG